MEKDNKAKTIDAVLKINSSDEEVIEMAIGEEIYCLNFTKEDQSYLRDFFKKCIDELLKNPFVFEFKKDPSIKNEVLIKVASDYITDLNKELNNCIEEINRNSDE